MTVRNIYLKSNQSEARKLQHATHNKHCSRPDRNRRYLPLSSLLAFFKQPGNKNLCRLCLSISLLTLTSLQELAGTGIQAGPDTPVISKPVPQTVEKNHLTVQLTALDDDEELPKGCSPCRPDSNSALGGTQLCQFPGKESVFRQCQWPPKPNDGGGVSCQSPAQGQIALFEHDNYRGRCKLLSPGVYPDDLAMGFPNDKASSVKLGPGAGTQLCEHRFFEGTCDILIQSEPNLGGRPIRHDRVSSVVVLSEDYPPFNCQLVAETPQFFSTERVISGTGTRGPNCFKDVAIDVQLKEDVRWWRDRTLQSRRGAGEVRYLCSGTRQDIKVYTEIRAGDQKALSAKVIIPRCRSLWETPWPF